MLTKKKPLKKKSTTSFGSKVATKVAKVITKFRPAIYSRHPSHSVLRPKGILGWFPFRSVIRFGSTTPLIDDTTSGGRRIEINTVRGCQTSSSKVKMKQAFDKGGVKTAKWTRDRKIAEGFKFPIVAKLEYGSRGEGMKKFDTLKEFQRAQLSNSYIYEEFMNYSQEYRLHVTEDGCFYTCRKMIKNDTPDDLRWFRNDSNSTWILDTNPLFDKPNSWNEIVAECVKALKAVGLDICSCDVRVQSKKNKNGKNREKQDFFIVEVNSASSFGEVTAQKYIQELPKLLRKKYEKSKH